MAPIERNKIIVLVVGAALLAVAFWLKGPIKDYQQVSYQPRTIKLHSKEYAETNIQINLWCDKAHTKVCGRAQPGATLEYESFDGQQYKLSSGYYISALQVESSN